MSRIVSIVSDYGLDDRVSIPERGRGFFLYRLRSDRLWGPPSLEGVQTVLSREAKRGRDVMLTTQPLLVPTLKKSRSYTSSPPKRHLWHVAGPLDVTH
jgi:hypothetical protein